MSTTSKNIWIGIVAVIVVIAALFAYLHASKNAPVTPSQQNASTTPSGNAAVGANGQSVVISYADSGFSPKSITVSQGTTITWVNNSSGMMWIASNSHPDHTAYDGTSRTQHCVNTAPASAQVFDECMPIPQGGSFSFTFTKAGVWSFHNHVHADDQGSVTVTAANSLGASAAAAPKLNPDAYPD